MVPAPWTPTPSARTAPAVARTDGQVPGDRSGAVERLGDVGEDLLERDADGLDAGPQPLHVPHVGERLDLGAHRIELGLQPLARSASDNSPVATRSAS